MHLFTLKSMDHTLAFKEVYLPHSSQSSSLTIWLKNAFMAKNSHKGFKRANYLLFTLWLIEYAQHPESPLSVFFLLYKDSDIIQHRTELRALLLQPTPVHNDSNFQAE